MTTAPAPGLIKSPLLDGGAPGGTPPDGSKRSLQPPGRTTEASPVPASSRANLQAPDANGASGNAARRRSSVRRASSIVGKESQDVNAIHKMLGRDKQGCCVQLRRKAAPFCRKLNRSKHFQSVMFVALLCALFLPDIWVLADIPHNDDLDVCLTIVLFFFIVELIVQSIGLSRSYWGSFFFYMDLIGAVSLLLDLTYFTRAINLNLDGGSGGKVGNNVVIMRAARMAKLGARAGRFTKLVKLLRFLPGMREQGTDQGTAKVISAQLMTALSTRVSCLIIVMVMVMPTFSMVTYPEQDWSMKSWMQILERMSVRHPERLQEQLVAFEKFYMDMNYFPYELNITLANDEVMRWRSSRGEPNRKTNIAVFSGDNEQINAYFNFSGPNQVDSGMNALLITVIIILMVCFSLVLSNSVSAIVLRPLEKLLQQVRKMASTIFKSVTDMAQTMREEEDTNEEDDDADIDEENGPSAFGTETQLLEKVVQKLAILSEITMTKSVLDAETMQQLGEGDRAVIHGFQGSGGQPIVGNEQAMDEVEEGHDENVLMAQRLALENAGLSIELLDSWDLNPLELDKARNHAAMTFFLGPHNHAVATYDPVIVSHFLEASESAYLKQAPYHNWFHAVDVTHGVYRMFGINVAEAYLNGQERYALLVSAVCHDIGHPGQNNPFLVETSHELALLYNDKSPLENMHCAKLFEIASNSRTAIFAGMTKPQYQEVRKVCVEAILHTDMTHHFSMVKDIQMMYEVSSEILDVSRDFYHEDPDEFPTKEAVDCFRQQDNRTLMRNLILHSSDVSNPMKPFRICRIWAWQVLEEFFLQGDKEKELNIQVQMLNDRDKVNRAFSQIGFIEFLVTPLIFAMVKILPPMEHCAEQMIDNVKQWKGQWINDTKPAPSADEQKAVSERIVRLEQKYKGGDNV